MYENNSCNSLLQFGRQDCRLFEIRHSSDYDDFVYCDAEMVREYKEKAKVCIDAVSELLN